MTAADPAPFIFIIAGEPSGDALGAALIRALRERAGTGLRVAGIGGEQMREQGVESLVPLSELAVAGVAEVLPHAPRLLRRIRETVAAIRAMRQDTVVTIDSSGFCWRVGRAAPPGRNPAVDRLCRADGLGLAPRPRRSYGALVRPCADPLAVRAALFRKGRAGRFPCRASGARKRRRTRRRGALPPETRHCRHRPRPDRAARQPRRRGAPAAADLRRGLERLDRLVGPFRVAVPTVATVAETVASGVADWPGRPIVLRSREEKFDAFAASRAALAASGTVALELALALCRWRSPTGSTS